MTSEEAATLTSAIVGLTTTVNGLIHVLAELTQQLELIKQPDPPPDPGPSTNNGKHDK